MVSGTHRHGLVSIRTRHLSHAPEMDFNVFVQVMDSQDFKEYSGGVKPRA